MTRDDDFIGQLEGYLDEYEGITPLPAAVRGAVRAQLPTTKQVGPPGWLLGRFPIMNSNVVRFGIAIAAVVLLAIAAVAYLPESVGKPDATATPTPTRLPTPAPVALKEGPLEAGTYVARPFSSPNDSLSFTFNVPDGWEGHLPGSVAPTAGTEGPDGAGVDFVQVTGIYSGSCTSDVIHFGGQSTVDNLASALEEIYGAEPSYEVTAPVDVTLSGYSGKRMDLLMPSDVDFSSCPNGGYAFGDGAPYAQGPGNRWHLWILEAAWERVVILAHDFAATSPQHQAELLAIVNSIRIEPPSTRGWPGAYSNPPGKYSWGSANSPNVRMGWMHSALLGEGSSVIIGTSVVITFAYSGDADVDGPDAVIIGGYPGTYQELIGQDGARTRRWLLEIEGTRVTITMTAEPNSTVAQLAEVDAIIESIRYEPPETGGFRLTFTLPAHWDSG
jgi:hypothetical protein